MSKTNLSSKKNKIIASVLILLATFSKVLFEFAGKEYLKPGLIALAVLTTVAFTAFFVTAMNEKGFSFFSGQGIFGTISLVMVFFVMMSFRLVDERHTFLVLMVSIALLCSQKVVTLPVSAAIVIFMVFKSENFVLSCAPAVLLGSSVYLVSEIKGSAIWKKIVFALCELVVLGSLVYEYYIHRFLYNTHAIITQLWDSAGSVVAVIFLVAFAMYAIKAKKSIIETIAYIVAAVATAIPVTMTMMFPIASASCMFLALTLACQKSSAAEELTDKIFDKLKKA